MSKKVKFAGLFILLVVILTMSVGTSLAKSGGPPYRYTSYMATCNEFPPEDVWVTGQVVHIKGMTNTGRIYGDPYFAGTFEQRVDVVLNTVTGSGNAHGTIVIHPNAYEGTWEGGHFQGPIIDFMFMGQGIDFGTGELEGLKDFVQVQEILPDELPAEWVEPCQGSPILSANVGIGKIIEK